MRRRWLWPLAVLALIVGAAPPSWPSGDAYASGVLLGAVLGGFVTWAVFVAPMRAKITFLAHTAQALLEKLEGREAAAPHQTAEVEEVAS